MTRPYVLILTHPEDVHADAVQTHLHHADVEVYRTDTADLGTQYPVTAHLHHGAVTGYIASCDLARVTCVWHRRPSRITATDPDNAAELQTALGGILSALPHLNHPADMAAAFKPRQLALAARCGLNVPETVITTERTAAQTLAARAGGPGSVVVKPMSRRLGGIVDAGDTAGWDRAAHLTQRRIVKTHDVRLTVVDDTMFAVHIDSPHLDWRRDHTACTYQPVPTPPDVAAAVRRFMTALRLRYAALDFPVDEHGRWWFLEANTNGQWLWIEEATGQPISAAIAQALATV